MNPTLGDFLGQAGQRIDTAVSAADNPPGTWAGAAIGELDRITTAMTRYLRDVRLPGREGPAGIPRRLPASVQATANIARAVRRAAVTLGPAARDLAIAQPDPGHPAVRELAAAADLLAAGSDLLQTHFTTSPGGTREPGSEWAPVITSRPIQAALASHMAVIAARLAPWAARLAHDEHWEPFVPAPARTALNTTSSCLQAAGIAGESALYLRSASTVAHRIPVNAPPRPVRAHGHEQVLELCDAVVTTAERLRYVTRATATTGTRPSAAMSSASWRRHAQAAAIISHCSETILRTLTDRAQELGYAAADLRITADALAQMWTAWRAAAQTWDTLTTGHHPGPTPIATETGDLVLWTGRLASRDPAWTPARGSATFTPTPVQLAPGHREFLAILGAVHHATDALTHTAHHDRRAVWAAASDLRLLTETGSLPLAHQVPYRYLAAPTAQVDELLAAYSTAVRASTSATAALDKLATALDTPTAYYAAVHVAARRQPPAPLQIRRKRPPPLSVYRPLPQPPGQIEGKLHHLGITDPHLLARAQAADQEAHDILDHATKDQGRKPTVSDPAQLSKTEGQHTPGDAVRLAAQDCPRQAPGIGPARSLAATGEPTAKANPGHVTTRRARGAVK